MEAHGRATTPVTAAAPTTTGPAADAGAMTTGELFVAAVAELKPRLRGWLHTYAAAVSLASGASLIAVAAALRGGIPATVTAIYCATVTLLFGTSALYHRRTWSPSARLLMKRLDHSMIFVFIAGTYTPIAVLTLTGGAMIGVLIAVWVGAAGGVALQLWCQGIRDGSRRRATSRSAGWPCSCSPTC